MPASVATGTQTATLDTEHTLDVAITTAGVYVLQVDTTNMANGDITEIRAKLKVLSTSTEAIFILNTFANIQSEPVKMTIPIPSLHSLKFTLTQTDGTGRDYPWTILSV